MTIDLHCHTKLSDGSTGINELIEIAKLRGLDAIAVTDHDTFAGSTRAVILGKRSGVTVVPGVEISAVDKSRGRKAHILCYYPQNMERLGGLLRKITASRRAAMSVAVQKVLRLYPMPMDMILARAHGSTNIFKQHIMQALMDAGYTDEMFGPVFEKLFHPKFGFAHTNIDYPDVKEVLKAVRSAGGAAVLAHPSEYDSMALFQELSEEKLIQGAEAFHPRNTPEDVRTIQDVCGSNGLLVTGGTDFHGCYTKVCNPPGTYLTEEEQFDKLKKLKIS